MPEFKSIFHKNTNYTRHISNFLILSCILVSFTIHYNSQFTIIYVTRRQTFPSYQCFHFLKHVF